MEPHNDPKERIIEAALREVSSGTRPPDLSEEILAEAQRRGHSVVAPAPTLDDEWSEGSELQEVGSRGGVFVMAGTLLAALAIGLVLTYSESNAPQEGASRTASLAEPESSPEVHHSFEGQERYSFEFAPADLTPVAASWDAPIGLEVTSGSDSSSANAVLVLDGDDEVPEPEKLEKAVQVLISKGNMNPLHLAVASDPKNWTVNNGRFVCRLVLSNPSVYQVSPSEGVEGVVFGESDPVRIRVSSDLVDLEELAKLRGISSVTTLVSHTQIVVKDPAKAFADFDSNEDGKLDTSELPLSEFFAEYDKDEDTSLSKEEFLKGCVKARTFTYSDSTSKRIPSPFRTWKGKEPSAEEVKKIVEDLQKAIEEARKRLGDDVGRAKPAEIDPETRKELDRRAKESDRKAAEEAERRAKAAMERAKAQSEAAKKAAEEAAKRAEEEYRRALEKLKEQQGD
ncbi:MAG: hypothetical protein KDB07_09765 [Planctomycetes bacterium]|nr:hypothetical protein [Planctomycetota bacterium]